MDKYRIRPYSPLDAQAVVDLINAASVQTVGFPRAVVDAVGNLWAYRFTPFTSEKIVAITESNEVVGYAFSTSTLLLGKQVVQFIQIIGIKELVRL